MGGGGEVPGDRQNQEMDGVQKLLQIFQKSIYQSHKPTWVFFYFLKIPPRSTKNVKTFQRLTLKTVQGQIRLPNPKPTFPTQSGSGPVPLCTRSTTIHWTSICQALGGYSGLKKRQTSCQLSARGRPRCDFLLASRIWVLLTLAASTTPPKFDPNMTKVIYLKYPGREVSATSFLIPKSGPLSLSPERAGDDIIKATSDWKSYSETDHSEQTGPQSGPVLCPCSTFCPFYLLPLR